MEFWNDPVELARVLGLLVPLAVAFVTKSTATPQIKSVANIILSALAGVTATLVGADGGWDWAGFFNAWFNAFLTGIVAYYGAYKPIGVSGGVADATRSIGFGGVGPPAN